MSNYAQHFHTLKTPQSEQAATTQRENNAGGYSFTVSKWDRLDRFLILGADSGTYYVAEKKLTVDNAKCILDCLAEDGARTVARIAEVSDRGLAPKNDAAIFALAIAAGAESSETRRLALAALPKVCRIGTHLFHFVRDVEGFRRWGRGLRSAVAAWYNTKAPEHLARDLVKYRQRDDWSHRDMLRLSHPQAATPQHQALFRYATGSTVDSRTVKRGETEKAYAATDALPAFIDAFEAAQKATSAGELCKLIREHRLTHEMLPTEWKNDVKVWEALLESGMPIGAMVRNLGKMTNVGLLKPLSSASRLVAEQLGNVAAIRKARLHPLAVLTALKIYQQGRGDKGSLTWSPDRAVVDALDSAFYLAFDAVEPTGKNILIALDVSGSMHCPIAGSPLMCHEAAAALAMVTARTEKNWHVVGFSSRGFMVKGGRSMHGSSWPSGIEPIAISPRQRLDDVVRAAAAVPMGGTDCALPMLYAQAQKLDVDAFMVFTDSETWAGNVHPHQALQSYRQSSGRNAKLCVVGMTATEFTIANPNDAGMLDVVGFSTDTPSVMSTFIASEVARP